MRRLAKAAGPLSGAPAGVTASISVERGLSPHEYHPPAVPGGPVMCSYL
jgi:hypothetical protein